MSFPSLNDRDALLEAAPVRVINLGQIRVELTPSAPIFHVNAAGVPDFATLELVATLVGVTGDVTWGAQNGTITGISGTNNVNAQLRFVDVTGPFVTVTASVTYAGVTYSKPLTISIVKDGQNGASAGAKVVTLVPAPTQVFKISKAGVNDIASITLDALGQNTTGTPNFTILSGTATLAAGANASQKILTYANMTSDSVTVKVTLDGQTDQVTIIKVREGLDGIDALNPLLSNEVVTLPAGADGTVTSVVGAVCTMRIYRGVTDDSGSWTYGYSPVASAGGLAYTTSGNTITVTGLAAGVDTAFVDITASRTGYASITQRFNVTKSKQGAQGTGTAGARGAGHYYVVGSSWSDVAAQAACPGGPVVNDVVTISSSTFVMEKRWTGSSWADNGVVVDGKLIVPDSILTSALAAESVTARNLAGDAVTARSIRVTGAAGALNRDPYFTDPASWTLSGMSGATGPGGAAPANTYIQGSTDYASGTSERFPIDSKKSYNTSVAVWANWGNNREFRVIVTFYDGNGAVITSSWSDQFGGHFVQTTIPWGDAVWRTYNDGSFGAKIPNRAIPTAAKFCTITIQINAGGTGAASAMAATGLRLDAMTSEVLIEPESIYAPHIKGDTLDVLAAKVGNVILGAGGSVRQNKNAFNDTLAGLFIGAKANGNPVIGLRTNNGAEFLCDPENNLLKMVNAQIDTPQYSAFSVSAGADIYGQSRFNSVNFGTRTAAIVGLDNVQSIRWTVDFDPNYGSFYLSNATSQTVGIVYSASNPPPVSNAALLTVTVVGKDGRTINHSISVEGDITG